MNSFSFNVVTTCSFDIDRGQFGEIAITMYLKELQLFAGFCHPIKPIFLLLDPS